MPTTNSAPPPDLPYPRPDQTGSHPASFAAGSPFPPPPSSPPILKPLTRAPGSFEPTPVDDGDELADETFDDEAFEFDDESRVDELDDELADELAGVSSLKSTKSGAPLEPSDHEAGSDHRRRSRSAVAARVAVVGLVIGGIGFGAYTLTHDATNDARPDTSAVTSEAADRSDTAAAVVTSNQTERVTTSESPTTAPTPESAAAASASSTPATNPAATSAPATDPAPAAVPPATETPAPVVPVVASPESAPPGYEPTIPDGEYTAVIDIAPGVYRVGPSSVRYEAAAYTVYNGPTDGDFFDYGYSIDGPLIMIVPDDPAFRFRIVGGAAPLESTGPLDPFSYEDGQFIVGLDIQPGTYTVTDDYPYWSRLNVEMGIVDNDLEVNPTTLTFTVEPGDYVVQFNGTLTKID